MVNIGRLNPVAPHEKHLYKKIQIRHGPLYDRIRYVKRILLRLFIFSAVLLYVRHVIDNRKSYVPEQIRIAYAEHSTDIVITWITRHDTEETLVLYGESVLNATEVGYRAQGCDGQSICLFSILKSHWVHKAILRDLKPVTEYVYIVGSKTAWSELLSFKTPPQGRDSPVRALIFADMGVNKAWALPALESEVKTDKYHLMLHLGDFGEQRDKSSDTWTTFLREIQPITARVPYMVCPGGNDHHNNFGDYKIRFAMPGRYENLFYSFDLGSVHFVSIDTELYNDLSNKDNHLDSERLLVTQFNWLRDDLFVANYETHRRERPWIIFYGHTPMYCSNIVDTDAAGADRPRLCAAFSHLHRDKHPLMQGYGLEKLLKTFGVDLAIWAHEHVYERTWPVFNKQVYNGSKEPYRNPGAPVHVTISTAGSPFGTNRLKKEKLPWTAFRHVHVGYARMAIFNTTHLFMEEVA